jgi:hypothetical protein
MIDPELVTRKLMLIIETSHPPPTDYYESFIRPDYLRAVQQYVEKTFPDSPR